MARVTTHQAKTQLSRLVARAAKGEEIVILRGERPAARLVALAREGRAAPRRPKVGKVTSAEVAYDDDAFAPLDDATLKDWGL